MAEDKLTANIEELVKANFELDRFVYSVSHDLRSPLTSVLGLLSFIEEDATGTETINHARMIRASINRLDDYVKNILSYSRNNRIGLQVEQIDLAAMTEETINALRNMPGAETLQFETDFSESQPFYSDRQSVSTILENLISNAVKFKNGEQPTCFIKVSGHADSEFLYLTVSDNGIGIDSKYQQEVFKMFFRLSGKVSGSGIGLYIVQEIVQKLQGSIAIESQVGIGTSFIIQLKNLSP